MISTTCRQDPADKKQKSTRKQLLSFTFLAKPKLSLKLENMILFFMATLTSHGSPPLKLRTTKDQLDIPFSIQGMSLAISIPQHLQSGTQKPTNSNSSEYIT